MTKRRPTTNAGRLAALEAELQPKDKPTIVICPSLDNPDLYYVSGKPGGLMPDINVPDYQTYVNGRPEDLMPKQDLIDRLEKDYTILVITYVKDWKNLND